MLSEYTTNELLRELLSRNTVQLAPNHVTYISHHKVCCVAVDTDNIADIYLSKEAYAELHRVA